MIRIAQTVTELPALANHAFPGDIYQRTFALFVPQMRAVTEYLSPVNRDTQKKTLPVFPANVHPDITGPATIAFFARQEHTVREERPPVAPLARKGHMPTTRDQAPVHLVRKGTMPVQQDQVIALGVRKEHIPTLKEHHPVRLAQQDR